MITIMRKHHKTLMIIITALVCISFSWFYNRTDFSSISKETAGTFYDHTVSQVEFQHYARLLRLASQLGMRDLVQNLTLGAQTETEAFDNFAWNLMVLRHEVDRLGIEPTTEEIANEVKSLPAFKGENGFDLAAYGNFVDHVLGSMGFTQSQIEELAADQIALGRLQKILGAGVNVPESELRENFDKAYAKMQVALVRFRPQDFGKEISISDDEVAKYYDAHKAELKSEEKRQVKLVSFGLSDAQKKLTGKERIDALQKLADAANDFTEALQAKGADFDQVAAKMHLTPQETGEFTQAKPAPSLASKPQLVQTAFALTKESPNSDAIQSADGFDILHLVKVNPPHPMTQEEARPQIVETLEKQQKDQKIAAKANDLVEKLRTAASNGQNVEQVATDAGVKLEKLPEFTLAEAAPGETPPPEPQKKNEAPDMPYIKQTVTTLEPGNVSNFVPTPEGGFVLVLEKRQQPTPAEFDKARAALEENAKSVEGQVVFYEWLRERRHAAGIPETKKGEIAPS